MSSKQPHGEGGAVYTIISTTERLELIKFDLTSKSYQTINTGRELFWDSGMVEVKLESSHFLFFAGGLDPTLNKEVSETFAVHLPIPTISESVFLENLEDLKTVKRRSRLLFDSNSIYSIGGVRELKNRSENRLVIKQCYTKNFERFQLNSKKWEALEDLPFGCELPACEVLEGRIFVFGGAAVNEGFFDGNQKVQVYSIALAGWTLLPVTLDQPVYGALAFRSEERIVVFGGINSDDESLKDVWSFDGGLNKIAVVSAEKISLFFPFCCWKFGNSLYGFNDDEQLIVLDLQNFNINMIIPC
jgi:hypothetical protein